jgi:hypothetical protein
MPRRAPIALTLLCVLPLAASLGADYAAVRQRGDAAQIAARQRSLQQIVAAYQAGDHDIVARTFRGRIDSVTRIALNTWVRDPRVLWSPARAAFVLEVAVALDRSTTASMSAIPDVIQLIHAGRTIVVNRPAPVGTDPSADRFEVLWHQIALALLQGDGAWDDHDTYLAAITPRAARLSQLTPPIPNRFALVRGINAEMQCCRDLLGAFALQVLVVSGRGGRPTGGQTGSPTRESAIAHFEAASFDPSLRVDALIRGAYLQLRLNRPSEALAWLDRVGPIADEVLGYASALTRGGAHDQLGDAAAAASAYQSASQLAPTAQVPAIGRAAALQRAGLTDEAVDEADRARRLPDAGADPWPTFMRADARYVREWLLELRTFVR